MQVMQPLFCVETDVAAALPGPPLEEHLAANTLWPEVHKLYGHGNNLYALAANPSGRLLASACQVTKNLTLPRRFLYINLLGAMPRSVNRLRRRAFIPVDGDYNRAVQVHQPGLANEQPKGVFWTKSPD